MSHSENFEFLPRGKLKARYATKMVDNRFYGKVEVLPSIGVKSTETLEFQIKYYQELINEYNLLAYPITTKNTIRLILSLLSEKIIKDHCR